MFSSSVAGHRDVQKSCSCTDCVYPRLTLDKMEDVSVVSPATY